MVHPLLPFRALGLRCNPFRALTPEEWIQVTVLPPAVEQALQRGFTHLQILGEKGRGKTSALRGLQARLSAAGSRAIYEYLPEGQSRFRTSLQELDVFLLDEVQRLSRREALRLVRAAAHSGDRLRLVLGSHKSLAQESRRLGPALETVKLDSVDADYLRAVLQRRLEWAALSPTPPVDFSEDALTYLRDTFGSDLRAMELFLYEVFQHLRTTGPIGGHLLREAHT